MSGAHTLPLKTSHVYLEIDSVTTCLTINEYVTHKATTQRVISRKFEYIRQI